MKDFKTFVKDHKIPMIFATVMIVVIIAVIIALAANGKSDTNTTKSEATKTDSVKATKSVAKVEKETTTKEQKTTEVESTTVAETTTAVETTTEEPTTEQQTTQAVQSLDQIMYAGQGMNVRSAATSDSNLLGHLDVNTPIHVTGFTDGWYLIDYNGTPAYVWAEYATETELPTETPTQAVAYVEPQTEAPVYIEPQTEAPIYVEPVTEPQTEAPTQPQIDTLVLYEMTTYLGMNGYFTADTAQLAPEYYCIQVFGTPDVGDMASPYCDENGHVIMFTTTSENYLAHDIENRDYLDATYGGPHRVMVHTVGTIPYTWD